MPNPLEIFQRPKFENSPFGDSSWMGRTAVVSGDTLLAVACAQVSSDSVILTQLVTLTNVDSGSSRHFDVKSINPGVGFVAGAQDGVGINGAATLHWIVLRTA